MNKENPPAFPTPHIVNVPDGQWYSGDVPNDGMTLRDYFAAKAMQSGFRQMFVDEGMTYEVIAANCYEMADAMLSARNQTPQPTPTQTAS